MIQLPIDAHIPEILETISLHPSLVLVAPPGTGKTTRVPPALLRAAFRKIEQEVIVLEPRRLAAKMSAERVADELNEEAGQTVGYAFKGENISGKQTRLLFYTEGLLLRRLLSDPFLKNVCCVVLDEFHERHIHSDVALSYLKYLQSTRRPDLKIIVMSATLEAEKVSEFLNRAPIINVKSPWFPVEIDYFKTSSDAAVEILVQKPVQDIFQKIPDGDILIFLPGRREIEKCMEALKSLCQEKNVLLTALYGDLSKAEQNRALQKQRERKIILSTNIAESSLTIDGIRIVIDSGLHREASFSLWSGTPSLKTKKISQASAIQRTGRAGRQAPGFCFRLYTKHDFDSRLAFDPPEIKRTELSQILLELKALGIQDLSGFAWYEAPENSRLLNSSTLLYRLGAIDSPQSNANLTSVGRELIKIPTHPRWARTLLEAKSLKVLEATCKIAAAIFEGHKLHPTQETNALDLAKASISSAQIVKEKNRLQQAAQNLQNFKSNFSSLDDNEKIAFSLLTGFNDRVALKKDRQHDALLVLASGGSAVVDKNHLLDQHYVVLEIRDFQHMGTSQVRSKVEYLAPIQEDWLIDLNPCPLKEEAVVEWNSEKQILAEHQRWKVDDLVLSEKIIPAEASDAAAQVLFNKVLGLDIKSLEKLSLIERWTQLRLRLEKFLSPEEIENIESYLKRAELIAEYYGLDGVKKIFSQQLEVFLLKALAQVNRIKDLAQIDWKTILAEFFSTEIMSRFEQIVPERIALSSQRKTKVYYKFEQKPWIESRLQDFIGTQKTPQILDGKLRLTVHLLAPNGRAVQVTQDLESFWAKTYPEIKKELSRRYPRHQWP